MPLLCSLRGDPIRRKVLGIALRILRAENYTGDQQGYRQEQAQRQQMPDYKGTKWSAARASLRT
jgi:hypothetical protein